jgi:hypothetical protein
MTSFSMIKRGSRGASILLPDTLLSKDKKRHEAKRACEHRNLSVSNLSITGRRRASHIACTDKRTATNTRKIPTVFQVNLSEIAIITRFFQIIMERRSTCEDQENEENAALRFGNDMARFNAMKRLSMLHAFAFNEV